MNEIISKIRAFLDQEAPETVGTYDDGTDLFTAGVIDSLRILSLVCFLEEGFGVALDHEDLNEDNFRTLKALAGLIIAKGTAPA